LTVEEMIGWAAFYELKNDESKKEEQRAQTKRGFSHKSR
tara:strand:- start:343 stop:459 length:117 start_codon:yes stop_codon:yes gene_type:complete